MLGKINDFCILVKRSCSSVRKPTTLADEN
jgi:hypothetical protein